MNSRSQVLELLTGRRSETIPCFGGLSCIIAPALETRGLTFHQIHHDAHQMAIAAASAHELYGWQSATLPTDLCVEAEALGATIDFRADMPIPMWPIVPEPLFESADAVYVSPGDFTQRGRIPIVLDALRELKARVGNQVAIGAFIPGPFTLAMQVVDFNALLPAVRHSPNTVGRALDAFTDALIAVADAYHSAGTDFITIHEMGGSPGVIGPQAFGELILPRLQRITAAVHAPRILSVCGNTNHALEFLVESGADALNVDQINNLARTSEILGNDILLFGNLDPVAVIANSDPNQIRAAVNQAAKSGADAIMPGCDLYLQTPAENLLAMVEAAEQLKRS